MYQAQAPAVQEHQEGGGPPSHPPARGCRNVTQRVHWGLLVMPKAIYNPIVLAHDWRGSSRAFLATTKNTVKKTGETAESDASRSNKYVVFVRVPRSAAACVHSLCYLVGLSVTLSALPKYEVLTLCLYGYYTYIVPYYTIYIPRASRYAGYARAGEGRSKE